MSKLYADKILGLLNWSVPWYILVSPDSLPVRLNLTWVVFLLLSCPLGVGRTADVLDCFLVLGMVWLADMLVQACILSKCASAYDTYKYGIFLSVSSNFLGGGGKKKRRGGGGVGWSHPFISFLMLLIWSGEIYLCLCMRVCATVHKKGDKYNCMNLDPWCYMAITTMNQFFFKIFIIIIIIFLWKYDVFVLFFLLDFEYTNWGCKENSHFRSSGTGLRGKQQLILLFTLCCALVLIPLK